MLAKHRNDLQLAVLALATLFVGFDSTAWCEDSDQEKLPKPQDTSLLTRDGVQLQATYYGSNRGKEAVPIVLLHDFKGTRNEFGRLAEKLQGKRDDKGDTEAHRNEIDRLAKRLQTGNSYAVLTVDLRGHGSSTRKAAPGREPVDLDASKFRPPDFLAMIGSDMEAVRKFLVRENDLGKLNLNKLCLVGVGMGATVAVNWAATDWSVPRVPSGKQGQDVQALVLISPRSVFKGVKMTQALKHPAIQRKVSVLIVYGSQDRRASRDAVGMYKRWLPFHPEPPESEGVEKQELFIKAFDANSQAVKKQLFDGGIDNMISEFINLRLVKQEFEWSRHRLGE